MIVQRSLSVLVLALALLAPAATALADHPAPGFFGSQQATSGLNSGGEGATWEVITSFVTGNGHTDLDFFAVDGVPHVAVGTLATGVNGGGQLIVQLVQDGVVDPVAISHHPSAACIADPSGATSLQHDVEVTPKGGLLFDQTNPLADDGEPQLLLDSTDAPGRCHDQGFGGLVNNPQGGVEIIDITDLTSPVEIGLTSHVGQGHTVNVDPKRPHIAFASPSEAVTIEDRPTEDEPDRSEQLDMDGFEVIDLSSCMDFAEGTSVQDKRDACRPEVYRFQFETDWTQGTLSPGVANGCHELEIYPDDTLLCAARDGTVLLDMSGAFDDNGTPDDYSDDTPRGTPLDCAVRASFSTPPFATGAMVTDCVDGNVDLRVGPWTTAGKPGLEGVELIGFVNHAKSGPPAAEDVSLSHEVEWTHSRKHIMVTDERGGGLLSPCPVGATPDTSNGGVHAYAAERIGDTYPFEDGDTPQDVFDKASEAYALTPDGDRAVYQATPRAPSTTSGCTAHVMHQVPGQQRIFMGWYALGTQVVDYIEHPDGTFEWREVAWFIPENTNTWTGATFQNVENADGTFTYWGVSTDLTLAGGRQAFDVWAVTLPPPAQEFVPAAPPAPPAPAPAPEAPTPAPAPLPTTGGGLAVLGMLGVLVATGRGRWSGRR